LGGPQKKNLRARAARINFKEHAGREEDFCGIAEEGQGGVFSPSALGVAEGKTVKCEGGKYWKGIKKALGREGKRLPGNASVESRCVYKPPSARSELSIFDEKKMLLQRGKALSGKELKITGLETAPAGWGSLKKHACAKKNRLLPRGGPCFLPVKKKGTRKGGPGGKSGCLSP